jgi:carbonic anhydrase
MGSVDYAVENLSESVRVVIALGHTGCGAVTGAVDAYLQPSKFWSKSTSPGLKAILHRIFLAVREAANGLKEVWGVEAREMPGYREALVESSVCVNTAHAAFDLHQAVERAAKSQIEVLYGVHNIRNHQVCMPVDPEAAPSDQNVHLAASPTNPDDFRALAVRMAEILKRHKESGHVSRSPSSAPQCGVDEFPTVMEKGLGKV